MKVVIFGSNGMLGSYLARYLSKKYEVVELTRDDLDISKVSRSDLDRFLKTVVGAGDVIINAAGIIKQRPYDILEMIQVNSIFPHLLAELKESAGCEIIHITTDCVFSGLKGGYLESDPHDSLDEYGKTKSLGEDKRITNLRTSIIGEEKKNKQSLLEWVRSNKGGVVDGFENHLWNGVTCLELSRLIGEIIASNGFWKGVRHVFSPNTVTKYELIGMINKIYDLRITINKKITDTDCYRNLKTSFTPLVQKPIQDQLMEMKEFKL